MTPPQALRHPWLRRRLPKAPSNENDAKNARRPSATRSGVPAKYNAGASEKTRLIATSDEVTQGTINMRSKLPQIGSTI
jgi:dual specificity tyrosine-phosphorylation-regulated kinase 2/3/4